MPKKKEDRKPGEPLKNLKHENFCQLMPKHKFNATKAYMEAYPDSDYDSARANSIRLITNDNIAERIHELCEDHCKRNEIDVNWVLDRLVKIAEEDDSNRSAKLRSLELIGKYLSMFTEKSEIRHQIDADNIYQKLREKFNISIV